MRAAAAARLSGRPLLVEPSDSSTTAEWRRAWILRRLRAPASGQTRVLGERVERREDRLTDRGAVVELGPLDRVDRERAIGRRRDIDVDGAGEQHDADAEVARQLLDEAGRPRSARR